MSSRKGRAYISAITAMIYISVSVPAYSQNSFGDFFGNAVGKLGVSVREGIENGIGIATYRQSPIFKKYVYPHLSDAVAYDRFIETYKNKTKLSEKEVASVLIQLGIAGYRQNWLTPKGTAIIDKYYPGVISKRTELLSPIRIAASNMNDAELSYELKVASAAVAIPLVLLTGAILGSTIVSKNEHVHFMSATSGFVPIFPSIFEMGVVTNDLIRMVADDHENMCSEVGGCTSPDEAVDVSINRPASPGGGNCECNCRAMDPTRPSTIRFGRWTDKSCSQAAILACQIASNRASVSNQHHVQAKCSDGNNYNMGGGLAR